MPLPRAAALAFACLALAWTGACGTATVKDPAEGSDESRASKIQQRCTELGADLIQALSFEVKEAPWGVERGRLKCRWLDVSLISEPADAEAHQRDVMLLISPVATAPDEYDQVRAQFEGIDGWAFEELSISNGRGHLVRLESRDSAWSEVTLDLDQTLVTLKLIYPRNVPTEATRVAETRSLVEAFLAMDPSPRLFEASEVSADAANPCTALEAGPLEESLEMEIDVVPSWDPLMRRCAFYSGWGSSDPITLMECTRLGERGLEHVRSHPDAHVDYRALADLTEARSLAVRPGTDVTRPTVLGGESFLVISDDDTYPVGYFEVDGTVARSMVLLDLEPERAAELVEQLMTTCARSLP